MKLIAGLGNPEAKYDGTRHNVGFAVLDALIEKAGEGIQQKKSKAIINTVVYKGEKLLLVKPQTYMNLSGESVGPLASYFNVSPEDVIVIVDDVALEPGLIRVRKSGSAGGHNGLKSIISHLGTEEFPRIRVGVGGAQGDMVSHVLGKFPPSLKGIMKDAIDEAAEAALCYVEKGPDFTMNKYNKKQVNTSEQ